MAVEDVLLALFGASKRRRPGCADAPWFWTRAWQRRERDAQHDLNNGQYQDFASVSDMIQTLARDALADATTLKIADGLRRPKARSAGGGR